MRLKTFTATYLLFLCILFTSVGIVSVYLSNSQMNMLREKSVSQYQTIAAAITRDIVALYNRNAQLPDRDIVHSLISGYARYYSRHNVDISVTDLSLTARAGRQMQPHVTFINHERGNFIYIDGSLSEPLGHFQFEYRLNITENITDMQNIQRILIFSAVVFSAIAAFALHFILTSIFRPLSIVAKAAREIAEGQFGERIRIKGKNELSQVALDFNKMAETIEGQMIFLEEEAVSKQQFVDNFAHEIRTPLTSVYGYAEYLQKASLNERDIIESAGYIMNEAKHMKDIANSLLELATLRNYELVKSEIYISVLFDNICQTMEKTLSERNVSLRCSVDAGIIVGQEDLIKSLLLNLCSNAMKACKPGEGIIQLEAMEEQGNTVISVTDNGCGIPEESLTQITEPFYRVDKSRSRDYGGTGLGLTLCRQIAQAHNAKMTIESTEGKGTTIKITFTTS